MQVKLISITQPIILGKNDEQLTSEELIVYCARVSNPSNQMNTETSSRLLSYLIRMKHWSPFEMIDFTVEIKTSRAIAAQILRHRSFSFQEFSQRYAEVMDMEPVQIRKQGATNRQSSTEPFNPTVAMSDIFVGLPADEVIGGYIQHGQALYKKLLEQGVAKEVARMILPLTTQTTIYMKGGLRSWIHYLQIRCDEHTQLEHQQVALQILEIVKENFPNVYEALNSETRSPLP